MALLHKHLVHHKYPGGANQGVSDSEGRMKIVSIGTSSDPNP